MPRSYPAGVRYGARDRDGAIELALELLATGRVRGVPPDHDPAGLDAVIGPPESEWSPDGGSVVVRHFGLLEVYGGVSFVAQLRWLKKPLKWKVLGPELRRLGYEVVHRSDRYEVTESNSTAVIFRGHVYSVSATALPRLPAGTPDFNAVHRTVYAAIGRPRDSWPGWLAEHGGPDPDRLRTAELTVSVVLREHPDRAAEAMAFHAFLLERAEAVWPADEWACRFARFAAEHGGRPGDVVAARCLAALPMDRAAAARIPADWRAITPADVRALRMTRALLRYAREAGPRSPVTSAELARWDVL